MAIRIKVRISSGKAEIETIGILNTGYEAENLEITISQSIAKGLKMYPELPSDTEVVEYKTVGDRLVEAHLAKKACKIWAITEDRKEGPVKVDVQ